MTLKSSILLIEDEENIRSFIATTLKNQGYKITTASTVFIVAYTDCAAVGSYDRLADGKTDSHTTVGISLGLHSYHRDLCQKP